MLNIISLYNYKIVLSLIIVGMHTTRGLECVESRVLELTAQEIVSEGFRSREVLSGQVLLAWLGAAIVHV